ncbi:MAG: hypothetical protein ACTHMC_16530 [Pseudobacter sp.]|uniref:hypothetical protein n=1 Tax=Pseudobacter sp. TaxID=2045420 RepID=UPI003F7FC356
MQVLPAIQYLTREQLDIHKWDQAIAAAPNGLPYAYSTYLDHMSRHWSALVLNDYEAVMPLTWNKKYGIAYLYQPAFTAQLGIFGQNLSAGLVKDFISAIPKEFRLIEIELNHANTSQNIAGLSLRNNYTLNLRSSYETLSSQYRDNIKRNIKKAHQLNLRYETGIPVADVITLSKSQMQSISNLTDSDYQHFQSLFNQLVNQQKAIACGVYNAANELIASCAYVISNDRACYIMVGNHPNGRTNGASHFLIDRFIHQHAGQPLLLDFEGSDIRNLAFFYSSFGATLETYASLRMDRLPWYVLCLLGFKKRVWKTNRTF